MGLGWNKVQQVQLSSHLWIVFAESDQEACWDYLLSQEEKEEQEEKDGRKERDCLLFEFSSEPLLPCYHVQVSLTQG